MTDENFGKMLKNAKILSDCGHYSLTAYRPTYQAAFFYLGALALTMRKTKEVSIADSSKLSVMHRI